MANAWLLKPLPIIAATAGSTAVGAALNVNNDYAGVVWRSGLGDSQALLLDLGADVAVDSLILFGLSGHATLATLQVQLATSAQGTAFSGSNVGTGTGVGNYWGDTAQPLLAGTAMPVSGRGVALWTAPATSGPPAAIRYVRLSFATLGGSGGAIEVARAVVGKRIQPERNFSFGAAFGVRDLGSLDFSRRAVMLRTRGKKLRTLGLSFANLARDEVEASTKPLIEVLGNTDLVAIVTDPDPHAQRQNRCYFGPLVGELSHVQRNARGWEAKINLVSIF